MSTKGGGLSLESTLDFRQTKLAGELFRYLSGKLGEGATKRQPGEVNDLQDVLFTDEENAAFSGIKSALDDPEANAAISSSIQALIKGLSGSAAGTPEDVTKNFLATQAKPLTELVNRDIFPEIDRTFRGSTSRRTQAKIKVAEDTADSLAQSLQQAQFQTMQLNAQIMLNSLGLSDQIVNQGLRRESAVGAVAESRGSQARGESNRLMGENNPYVPQFLAFLNNQATQLAEKPATLTGFGQALQGISDFNSAVPDFGPAFGAGLSGGA